MKLKYIFINRPSNQTQAGKFIYDGTEKAFQKSMSEDLQKIKNDFVGKEIIITLDFKNSIASFAGDDLSSEDISKIERAIKK